ERHTPPAGIYPEADAERLAESPRLSDPEALAGTHDETVGACSAGASLCGVADVVAEAKVQSRRALARVWVGACVWLDGDQAGAAGVRDLLGARGSIEGLLLEQLAYEPVEIGRDAGRERA